MFPFLLTETSHQAIGWYYFFLVIIWVIPLNLFYTIARFVICNYLKGGESRICLVICNYISLYRLRVMPKNKVNESVLKRSCLEYSQENTDVGISFK